jgi:hypothetical protein
MYACGLPQFLRLTTAYLPNSLCITVPSCYTARAQQSCPRPVPVPNEGNAQLKKTQEQEATGCGLDPFVVAHFTVLSVP